MRLILPAFALLLLGGPAFAADAFADLNAYRERNGLPKFARDEGLSRAAEEIVQFRAARLMRGHTPSDFAFLPRGSGADAAGCNDEPGIPGVHGILACGLNDDHTHAGAAVTTGPDGRVYWHVFYRGGSGRTLLDWRRAINRPYTPVRVAAKDPAPKKADCPCQRECPCGSGKHCTCGDACKCPDCPGKAKPDAPLSYAAGYAKAVKENKPLVVFVACPSIRPVPGAVTAAGPVPYPLPPGTGVLVLRPDGKGRMVCAATLKGCASDAVIAGYAKAR